MEEERGTGYKIKKLSYEIFVKCFEGKCNICNYHVSMACALLSGFAVSAIQFLDNFKDLILASILMHYSQEILVSFENVIHINGRKAHLVANLLAKLLYLLQNGVSFG